MSGAPQRPQPKRRPPVVPRPFFSLAIVYIFVFFFLYAVAFVAPTLWELGQQPVPLGTEHEAAAKQAAFEAAREAAAGRMGLAFLLSLATVVLGVWSQKLPGFRKPPR